MSTNIIFFPSRKLLVVVEIDHVSPTRNGKKKLKTNGCFNNHCFPFYHSLVQAKKKLIPEGIVTTDVSIDVPLQDSLDKTVLSIQAKILKF